MKEALAEINLSIAHSNMDVTRFSMQSNNFNLSSEGRSLKKPEKPLPCPRCNSTDTKFCYYNNYNVNQPRHFCKGCQRYWTAGGTLRNVAIGAGRRKRKHCPFDSESNSEVSSVECNQAKEPSTPRRASNGCGSAGGMTGLKASNIPASDAVDRKPQCLSFGANTPLLENLAVSKVQDNATNAFMRAKRSLISQYNSGTLCSAHDRSDTRIFHDFLQSKHDVTVGEKYTGPHFSSSPYDMTNDLKLEIPRVQANMQKHNLFDIGSKFALATPSDESGCSSSLTTQAPSMDVCVNDIKSDITDSEVSKSGNGSRVPSASGSLQPPFFGSCKKEGGSATSSFSESNVRDGDSIVPSLQLKGHSGNPESGTSWQTLSMPSSLYTGGEMPLFWGVPWGPTSSAVDAAKAALVSDNTELPRPYGASSMVLSQRTKPPLDAALAHESYTKDNASSEMHLWAPKSLRIKDVNEAARNSIWLTLGIREKQGSTVLEQARKAIQHNANEVNVVAIQSQCRNPAALSKSMTFHERS
ncbi:hypothetical protein KP509_20G020200 [Ceratopteris richardii]|uniref:Dof-type domain-containing protein n=1 Tax=Ceratopteris richardii TaxID=49495 RepID=A0A8T2SDM6_CERRI|nr:hypothetical protein KP509_20G020200 [Ceratopteris richardii]KAH7331210.1 hypothetical protein KP509_20G020200 [Ceratopteris richardii]